MEGSRACVEYSSLHRAHIERGTASMRLLSRVLRQRRRLAGFDDNLLDEAMAYQLVWPD
ncbi:MAG: hypothetical protein ACO1SV_18330 [Fimbriimonas sp.]